MVLVAMLDVNYGLLEVWGEDGLGDGLVLTCGSVEPLLK